MNLDIHIFMVCPSKMYDFSSFYCLKVMENEDKLKESLIECDREKEDLERRCTLLEREKAEQSQTVGYDCLLLWVF